MDAGTILAIIALVIAFLNRPLDLLWEYFFRNRGLVFKKLKGYLYVFSGLLMPSFVVVSYFTFLPFNKLSVGLLAVSSLLLSVYTLLYFVTRLLDVVKGHNQIIEKQNKISEEHHQIIKKIIND